jgi:hypothetical protein
MWDGADQQGMAGLFPVGPPFERPFPINEDVGDVLDVAHFPFTLSHFQRGIAPAWRSNYQMTEAAF